MVASGPRANSGSPRTTRPDAAVGGQAHTAGMPGLLATLLAPLRCRGCALPGTAWCSSCAGLRVQAQWVHIGIPVLTGLAFDGPARRVIIDWKDNASRPARDQVTAWLGSLLLPWLDLHPDAIVVPVPSAPGADRRRGDAPLARVLRALAPDAVCTDALVSIRPRRDQSELGRAQRQVNVAGSMTWRGGSVASVVVVDDILTTGSTLREAARAIGLSARSSTVGCALAHTEHGGPVANTWAGLCW